MLYLIASKPYKSSPCRYFHINNSSGAPRTLTFIDKTHAEKFRTYMIDYRFTHCEWPYIDASTQTYTNCSNCSIHHSKDMIGRHINIIGWLDDDINDRSHNTTSIVCHTFDYNEENLYFSIKASERCEHTTDPSVLRFKLENYL